MTAPSDAERFVKYIPCQNCGGTGKLLVTNGPYLKHLRIKSGLTAKDFSAAIRTHPSIISAIEHEDRPCPAWILAKYKSLRSK